MSKSALTVLAECVDIRSGKRFARGEEFTPAPNHEQAKRLVAAGCLPEEALKQAVGAKTDAEVAIEAKAARDAAEAARIKANTPAAKAKRNEGKDGPTVAEYVAAGYLASTYPPKGFASRSTPEEIDAAIAAEKAAQADGLAELTAEELKGLAEAEAIDLAGATKKDDIVAAIRVARSKA